MVRITDDEVMRVYKKLGLAEKQWNGVAHEKSSHMQQDDDDVWVVEEDSVTTISQSK